MEPEKMATLPKRDEELTPVTPAVPAGMVPAPPAAPVPAEPATGTGPLDGSQPNGTPDGQTPTEGVPAPQTGADGSEASDPDMFPREYVQNLRREAAGHRDRAKKADEYATQLHTLMVEKLGKLADPSDLPFDEAHLTDPAALEAAVEALLEKKPHLASRKVYGDIGQGTRGDGTESVSLAGILRQGAM